METRVLESIDGVAAVEWDALFGGSGNPFMRHAFLRSLEDSGCVGPDSGWLPRHLLLEDDGRPLAAMPLYVKRDSYGEFVFDWGWAQAYARHGLDYYPKLVTAVPFTPSMGPRLGLAGDSGRDADRQARIDALVAAAQALAAEEGCSSWHLLFPESESSTALARVAAGGGLLRRKDVQFHWRNRDYATFEDFLATFKASRRKNLKRERRRVAEQGVSLERIEGPAIGDRDWDGFYRCYVDTYLKRSGHTGYLTRGFFEQLRANLAEQLLLVVARREGRLIAAALCLHDRDTLYGRYWGALEEVRCLHFEACFYQGIEYCIERGLQRFDPGTQGEHKLLRGFEPVATSSWHWIADARFRSAIEAFLSQERRATERYGEQAENYLPYRRGPGGPDTGSG